MRGRWVMTGLLMASTAWAQEAPETTSTTTSTTTTAPETTPEVAPETTPAEDAPVGEADEVPTPDEAPADPEPEPEPTPEPEPAPEPEPEPAPTPKDTNAKKKKVKRKLLGPAPELKFTWGGMVQYDLRFRVPGTWPDPATHYNGIGTLPDLSRNELLGKFRGGLRYGNVGIKADLDVVLRAYPNVEALSDLPIYNSLTPFRFEAHELFAYYRDLFGAPGLDLRIGQQKIAFGVGDQFNPTNNANPLDLEDVLLFGDQIGNLMVRMDYSPVWNVQLTGALIPIFKPAMLPRTGPLAQTPDRYPYVDPQTRWNFNVEQAFAASTFEDDGLGLNTPTIVGDVSIQQPEFSAANMQGYFRAGFTFGSQDLALSYYRGRFDLPQPISTTTRQINTEMCADPNVVLPDGTTYQDCVNGVLSNDVVLGYPRMHVVGLNWAGEAVIGYRVELGLYIPEGETRNPVTQENVEFVGVKAEGPYQFPTPDGDIVVQDLPFLKWVAGIDYTFGKHVYLNAMWIHGFPDEFGAGDWILGNKEAVTGSGLRDGAITNDCITIEIDADPNTPGLQPGRTADGKTCAKEYLRPAIGDYLVLGLDFNFASQRGMFRLFTIWDVIGVYEESWDPSANARVRTHHHMFTEDGFSAVIYPDFRWKFGNGFELHAGALINLGKSWTRFGAPEVGGTQIWTRARYSF